MNKYIEDELGKEESNMKMLKLIDVIPLENEINIAKTKIVFNIAPDGNRNKMSYKTFQNIDYIKEERELWFEQIGWYFNGSTSSVENLIFLTQYTEPGYGKNYYLFTGIYKKESSFKKNEKSKEENFTLLNIGEKFIGRLIFKMDNKFKNKTSRGMVAFYYQTVINDLNVYELRAESNMSDFPGYANVLLNFSQLQQLARDESASWVAALSNVKAIYLQTDLKNGKHYVGSASGNGNGLWQRWVQYANGDHTAGNCDLISLVQKQGKEYIEENFQYSILEIFDTRVDFDNVISPREDFWKRVLDSRNNGYNSN